MCSIVASITCHGFGCSCVHSLDFETYSEAGFTFEPAPPDPKRWTPPYKVKGSGLRDCGSAHYAEHPSTEVLCMSYNIGQGVKRWMPGLPLPMDLFWFIRFGGLIEAHNSMFEYFIWNYVCVPRYGFPPIDVRQLRCSASKARRFSLPGALGNLTKVLGGEQKDKEGARLIQKLCRPLTPTKNRSDHRWTQATAWDDFLKLYAYCDQDIISEEDASRRMPDLTEVELEVWQTDQEINARGVGVDVQTLLAALVLLQASFDKYNQELASITQGAVTAVSQNKRFIEWVCSRGVMTSSLDEDHRAALLETDLPHDVRRAIEIADLIGSANVRKLKKLKAQINQDGRLRNQYVYCGADRTSRWSAGGVQLQNLSAKGPKTATCEACGAFFGAEHTNCPHCDSFLVRGVDWTPEAVERVVQDIRTCSFEEFERRWCSPVDALTGCLRGLLVPAPNRKFICVDFSAIEAVVAACLSRCMWRIELFQDPERCIYTESASGGTGTSMDEYWQHKRENGNKWCHPDRKKYGKIMELALGYGGWIGAMVAFGADAYFKEPEMKDIILQWRDDNPEIVHMWGGQYIWCGPGKWDYRPELHGLEGMAISAILQPGEWFSYNDISYIVQDDILYCRLPSGRFLHYHRPRLALVQDKLKRGQCYQITFEGWNSNSQKGPVGWHRMETYGGRLFENVVQAVARDIQAAAMVRCAKNGYPWVMHTHDEGTAEVPDNEFYTVEGMVQLMTVRESWFEWYPIRADGWQGNRYRKD